MNIRIKNQIKLGIRALSLFLTLVLLFLFILATVYAEAISSLENNSEEEITEENSNELGEKAPYIHTRVCPMRKPHLVKQM